MKRSTIFMLLSYLCAFGVAIGAFVIGFNCGWQFGVLAWVMGTVGGFGGIFVSEEFEERERMDRA